MCIVSAVHQGFGQIQVGQWSPTVLQEYLKMVESAKKIDEMTNQPDCVDPAKEKLVKDILEYLEKNGKLK